MPQVIFISERIIAHIFEHCVHNKCVWIFDLTIPTHTKKMDSAVFRANCIVQPNSFSPLGKINVWFSAHFAFSQWAFQRKSSHQTETWLSIESHLNALRLSYVRNEFITKAENSSEISPLLVVKRFNRHSDRQCKLIGFAYNEKLIEVAWINIINQLIRTRRRSKFDWFY